MKPDSHKSFAQAIQDVIHDLKTPLSSISLSIDMILSMGEVNEQQSQLAESALERVQFMNELIDTLLQVAWIDSDLPLKLATVDFRDVISESIGFVEQKAAERGITLFVDVPDHALTLECDKQRIVQVMVNLLSNAVKFNSNDRGVFVAASGESEQIKVTIRDEGIGISESDREKVFSRFYRSESVKKAKIDGTGLGLANARDITLKHGGSLWFESILDGGTTFYLMLPRQAVDVAVEGQPVDFEAGVSYSRDGGNQYVPPIGGESSDGTDDSLQEVPDSRRDLHDDDTA